MTDTENLPDRKYQDLYEDYQILSEEYQVLSNVCRDIYDDYQLLSEEYQNLDDEYQDLYDNYAICRSGAELDNEKKLKESLEANRQAILLKQKKIQEEREEDLRIQRYNVQRPKKRSNYSKKKRN